MKVKEIKKVKSNSNTNTTPYESFPKMKLDGFYQAVQNTDMLEVIEKLKRKK